MISNNHFTLATYAERMTTKQWKEALLKEEDIFAFRGHVTKLIGRRIGPGVYLVYKNIKEAVELHGQ